ncbi:hypothetical protein SAMN02983003_0135 [Devosia enhydra]|uniref:Uncharacterized protein n=1 Tax=Devosia enhydra TaxID=665118 RepID=A0A1K2HSC2_9HYPH|nr:hypothetical protein [Devosia enhydra]SFZ80792.1 hypothetical protein SAMN02983003_0135 [Devosia enhydra]
MGIIEADFAARRIELGFWLVTALHDEEATAGPSTLLEPPQQDCRSGPLIFFQAGVKVRSTFPRNA